MDIKTIFLNIDIKETIYIKIPENQVASRAKQIIEQAKIISKEL